LLGLTLFKAAPAGELPGSAAGGLSMRLIAFVCFACVWLVAAPAKAADAEKLDGATVVQGKVRTVFRDDNGDQASTVTYLYELVIEKVEQAKPGDGLKEGKPLYARAERLGERVKIPDGVSPPLAFIMAKPAKGDTVRVYCDRQDDGLYRVRANVSAVQVIKSAKER
jgi:hypothetical protein